MTTEDILEQIKKQFTDTIEEAVSKMVIPDPVTWIEKNFYIPENRKDPRLKGRIKLIDYQRDVLREALSTD